MGPVHKACISDITAIQHAHYMGKVSVVKVIVKHTRCYSFFVCLFFISRYFTKTSMGITIFDTNWTVAGSWSIYTVFTGI